MSITKQLAFFFVVLVPALAHADSPLTSTEFFTAYLDVRMVAVAQKTHQLTPEIEAFLVGKEHDLGTKMAVINALGWSSDGQINGLKFQNYLLDLHGMEDETPEQLACLGYLWAMDKYNDPSSALIIVKRAAKALPKSQTAALIEGLVKAQQRQSDGCEAWTAFQAGVEKQGVEHDIRPEAIKVITDYMSVYRNDCGKDKTSTPR